MKKIYQNIQVKFLNQKDSILKLNYSKLHLSSISQVVIQLLKTIESAVRFALCVLMSLLLPLALGVLALREQIAADVLCDTRTADALWLIPICILLTGVENVMKSALFGMNRVKIASLSEFIEQTIRYSLVILLLLLMIFLILLEVSLPLYYYNKDGIIYSYGPAAILFIII